LESGALAVRATGLSHNFLGGTVGEQKELSSFPMRRVFVAEPAKLGELHPIRMLSPVLLGGIIASFTLRTC
jgi:hypothetical protein